MRTSTVSMASMLLVVSSCGTGVAELGLGGDSEVYEVRTRARCEVRPALMTVGDTFVVAASGLSKGAALRVVLTDALGRTTFAGVADMEGRYALSQSAQAVGAGRAELYGATGATRLLCAGNFEVAASCGDGTCDSDETCQICPEDCGACGPVCGDGACEEGEPSGCPQDCPAAASCGDGSCDEGESCVTCSGDCGACPVPGCTAIANHGSWRLCSSSTDRCEAIFSDGAGCTAVCAAAGLPCLAVYEDVAGSCAPALERAALSCDVPSGHASDYCVCGTGAEPEPTPEPTPEDPPPPTTSCAAPYDGGPLPVFPGAQGFGTTTPAGRGGAILKVTNLNDSGSGSLRAALDATGPRIIVFEVSGRIALTSDLVIRQPFVTVAGQTAPAPGIQLTGRMLRVTTHDVLLQHLIIRVGDEGKSATGAWDATDVIQMVNSSVYNVVIDHVTANFGIDENVSTGYGAHDITISNSLVALPLNDSVHSKGPHGYNMLIAVDSSRISMIGNLLAHAEGRNPYLQACSALFANNLVYNNGAYGSSFVYISSDESITKPWSVSIVGNQFIDGPDSAGTVAIKEKSSLTHAASQTFVSGNSWAGGPEFSGTKRVSSAPAGSWPTGFVAAPVSTVTASVLATAGSRPTQRDPIDAEVVASVGARSGSIINSQSELGGFPVYAQTNRAFEAGLDPHGDADCDGYTNVEELLHQRHLELLNR